MYPPQGAMLRLSRIVIDGDKDWQGHNVSNMGTLEATKEIVSTEEVLVKQVLKPTAAGGDALVIRDVTDTMDRVVIREDGSIRSGTLEVAL